MTDVVATLHVWRNNVYHISAFFHRIREFFSVCSSKQFTGMKIIYNFDLIMVIARSWSLLHLHHSPTICHLKFRLFPKYDCVYIATCVCIFGSQLLLPNIKDQWDVFLRAFIWIFSKATQHLKSNQIELNLKQVCFERLIGVGAFSYFKVFSSRKCPTIMDADGCLRMRSQHKHVTVNHCIEWQSTLPERHICLSIRYY